MYQGSNKWPGVKSNIGSAHVQMLKFSIQIYFDRTGDAELSTNEMGQEYRGGLPEDAWPVGPSVVCCPLIRWLTHQLQVNHVLGTVPYASADAVCACVASTNDHNVLVLQCEKTNAIKLSQGSDVASSFEHGLQCLLTCT